jgi:ATP-dependent Clp protease ATP-binding subunit ClpC
MFENYTERAKQTMRLAEEEARKLGYDYVGTGMLLLGVVGAGGTASKILADLGITMDAAREEVLALMGRGPGHPHVEVPLSENARLAIECASEEASKRSIKDIAASHLLFGLVNGKDTVATRTFDVMGVEVEEAKKRVLDELDKSYGPRA